MAVVFLTMIVKDSVSQYDEKTVNVYLNIDEGQKYYLRNVTKIRAIPPGKNWPNNMPAAIAITTLVNNDTLIFFMVLLYFEANGGSA